MDADAGHREVPGRRATPWLRGHTGREMGPCLGLPHGCCSAKSWCTPTTGSGGQRGAVMLGEEMIDEASRKMATAIAAKGRVAGMRRTSTFEPAD
jgi:hypothetical protein